MGDLSGPVSSRATSRGQIDLMRNSRSCIGRNHWVWYTLVHTNQSNSGSADSENYRVVNSAYELRIHACIRLSQFSEFPRPVRIQYCPSRLGAKLVRTPSERGLDLFLSTSWVCKNGRFNWHGAHGSSSLYIPKGCSGS